MKLVDALASFMDAVRGGLGQTTWPPLQVKRHWDTVASYRRRYENDRDELLAYAPEFNRSEEKKSIYTPVPLARDVARLSASLLFSDPAKFTLEAAQDELDKLIAENGLEAFLAEAAEYVAVEGVGALRIIRDESVSDEPLITHVHEDQVIWDIRHGRFPRGGAVVIERNWRNDLALTTPWKVYRLIEYHEVGRVRRELYKGSPSALGSKIALTQVEEFAALAEEEETGLDVPTLVMWRNVPGGYSDFFGLDVLLDRVNEAESLFVDKGRKSVPITFADRTLADESGHVDLAGIVLTGGGNLNSPLGESPQKTVETVQPGLQSEEHIAWLEHTVNLTLELAGYSRATWGRDQGGSADSGKALKLRQARTLMTRAGKERMARSAIADAVAIALALKTGGDPKDLKPDIRFGDGMPKDALEDAQEIALLHGAEAISIEESVRRRSPELDDAAVEQEVERIRSELAGPQPTLPKLDVSLPDGKAGAPTGEDLPPRGGE